MTYDSYECIAAERRGRILTLTLNNPPLNAVDDRLHEELARIFLDVQDDDEADVIVLTGAGKMFSAGGDLKQMKDAFEQGEMRLTLVDAKRIVFSLLDLEKPIIAAVNGHAMGLGATIALFCDVIFMSTVGMKPILIHGGGKAISQAMQEAGIEPRFVQGRRYTDAAVFGITTGPATVGEKNGTAHGFGV